ncbi:hypothetical protein VTK73DRAFT_6321 [Phialemonium thermophilum]|uniref:thioredoxin-dependent peroxiredoxin n=1 Tax=Phialemonium thermophilum TaxID=223376 RepID=A0ABR3WJW6_9PEZI
MPVELRKRKAPPPPPEPPAKKVAKAAKSVAARGKAVAGAAKPAPKANGSSAPAKTAAKPAVGDVLALDGFGGEVETNDGKKTTLKALVDESKAGVVLFTYPKASTPGCTNQACLFRDSFAELTAGGLSIYGLSTDSPKANTTFQTKQRLPYPLLCDPSATLISAIGLAKTPRGTTRGVFVVDKSGKVLAAQPGSPAGTVEVVRNLVKEKAQENGEAFAADAAPVPEGTAAAGAAETKEEAKPAAEEGTGAAAAEEKKADREAAEGENGKKEESAAEDGGEKKESE